MSDRPAILVTGGAGYIGSYCCRALDAAGYQPVCYDNFSTGHRSFVTGALVTGDIADKATLAHTFAQHDITAVMHFAASSLVGESVVDPQKYYLNNLAGTLALLDAMRAAGCNRLVFSSTGAVYGNADSQALSENYACAPINPYGASKWMIERVLADYRAAYGLGSFALRYFNASGADPSGGIGELREVETHLIPRAMMALQGHVPDFAVFGDDYATPDGTAIRDYIHVTDLAAAHVLALKLLLQGHSGGAFNLGTGKGFSVREILGAIQAETGREVPHVVKPRRVGDPTYLVADPSAARATLNFKPAHSDLATIIRTAWAWHKKAHPLKTGEPVRDSASLSPAA
ncbi:UDP-glucose 4-epimerase GalE [Bradyrhizobium sp. Ash2021]|uniref:UDP-glucose 4-epimerase GalE n=1 Tax=Bradyrhizobium sp. Ash2021 TaxID=2954771 RepID=UPI00281514D4|nr:UDP-glucose 4-epimerase GalE [Bradyrhizobium sp. Ash2021]WMT76586.1 UDP-glucose 4-epimerase GalE [Bradyrhizobium sp. Ash2021]